MKKLPEKETDIQLAICDYLSMRRIFFWRQNTIPPTFQKDGQRQFRRMPKYSMNGIPDIICIIAGVFVGLEVKREGGVLSESQVNFSKDCLRAGGEYHVVHSVEEVIKKLNL